MAALPPSHPHRPDSRAAHASQSTSRGAVRSRPRSALAFARNFLSQSGKAANQGKVSDSSARPEATLSKPRGQPSTRDSLLRPTTPSHTLVSESIQDTRRPGRYSSLFRRPSGPDLATSPVFSASSSSLPLTHTMPLDGQSHSTRDRQRRASFSHLTRGKSSSGVGNKARVATSDVLDEGLAQAPPSAARKIYKSEDVVNYIRQGVVPQSNVDKTTEAETRSAILASSSFDNSSIAPETPDNSNRPHRRSNSLSSAALLSTDAFSIRRGIFERKKHTNKDEHDCVVSESSDTLAPTNSPTPLSGISTRGTLWSDRPSSSQSFSLLPRSSNKLRLKSSPSTMTGSIKSAGRKGWTVVRGRVTTPTTSADESGWSLTSSCERDLLNDATQRWLQLEDASFAESPAGHGLIFGVPLASAVIRTRLVSPGADSDHHLGAPETVDRSQPQGEKVCLALAESPASTIGTLDFGEEFTFPLSLLTGETGDGSALQSDEIVTPSANTNSGAHLPQSSPVVSNPLDRQSARHQMLPRFVTRCLESLETFGVQEEGIYRLSGRSSHTARLRTVFDGKCEPPWARQGGFAYDLDLRLVSPADCDINSVCSILKAYLRELPQPLLTRAQLGRLDASLSGDTIDLDEARDSLQDSGVYEWYLMREIALHLLDISSDKAVAKTRMTLSSICLVLAPTLAIPVHLLRFIVQEHEALFASGPRQNPESSIGSRSTQLERACEANLLIGESSANSNRQSNASSVSTILPRREQAGPGCAGAVQSGQVWSPTAAPALTWLTRRPVGSQGSDRQHDHRPSTSFASLSLSCTDTASTQQSCPSLVNLEPQDSGVSSEAASSLNTIASATFKEGAFETLTHSAACSSSLPHDLPHDMPAQPSPDDVRGRAGSPTLPSFTLTSYPALSAAGDKHMTSTSSVLIPQGSSSSLRSSRPPSQYVTPTSSPRMSEGSP
ncbi:hypothetical protein BCV69DRAFT_60259 [Microstroma glucosiphilum]|uniref:Rho-GAP domain-containing protein n=1 Tax=Pseudomicrostroma glucosiphilum TaxID=1684307 RepID=A0A316U2W1_9BASI|nr:hypothetical protein BCV69DRAFT_60259 [Pseudomicrostroma glucosiphilum]PWN18703.1 hypothetical protein BCV69DRAFT_60259 [Pseudomicrostroma glucosiphilum]